MTFEWREMVANRILRLAAVAVGALVILAGAYFALFAGPEKSASTTARAAESSGSSSGGGRRSNTAATDSLDLNEAELKTIKVEEVSEHLFSIARDAVGNIDFNQDNSLQVFTPYPGRITKLLAKAGDAVKKGQLLFEIDSPDLVNAESNLIQAASNLVLNDKSAKRAKELYASQGLAQKDYEAAANGYEVADGAYRGARDAVRIFGKSDAEIDQIVATRHIEGRMSVFSPTDGNVTARNAAVGLYVQPGNVPAPYTVADISTMWMVASVPETDIPLLRLGEDVDVKVMAYPGRLFHGKITNIGASVDPATHRLLVRSEIPDPSHELRAQMFATFIIRTGEAVQSPAAPEGGVVREGDGTRTVWVTTEGHRFTKRIIKIGLQQDGVYQVLDGLRPGDRIATDGALFLDNALTAASR